MFVLSFFNLEKKIWELLARIRSHVLKRQGDALENIGVLKEAARLATWAASVQSRQISRAFQLKHWSNRRLKLRFWFHRRNGTVMAHADPWRLESPRMLLYPGNQWMLREPFQGWQFTTGFILGSLRVRAQVEFSHLSFPPCTIALQESDLASHPRGSRLKMPLQDTYCIPAVSLQLTGRKCLVRLDGELG